MRILIVEDDRKAAAMLARGLSESGHVVDCVGDGEAGLAMAVDENYDVAVIDRMLPLLDGVALVAELRKRASELPVLMLSAVASMTERVAGLRAGCDDYLAKPFAFSELLARLEALGRRVDRDRSQDVLRIGALELDRRLRRAKREDRDILLQRREYLLLECLMRHAGKVVTRAMLLEAGWNYDFDPRGNIIDMHIHRLRSKIDRGFEIAMIQTVAGAGYSLK